MVISHPVFSCKLHCAQYFEPPTLGAIVAPLLANLGDSGRLPMAVYGVVSGLAAVFSLGLGPETMGVTTLPDTLEEGEIWGMKEKKRKRKDWTWSDKVTPERRFP